jgi:uncharacterized protein DUF4079
VLAYVHPISAAVTIALLGYVGSLGLRGRADRRRGAYLLRRHARLAPVMYALVVTSWVAGAVSTWWLRRDLELATSPHFRIGIAIVLTLSAGAGTSRWMQRPPIRALHPWFGAAAMLLAAAQVFFGLQMTP